MLAPSYVEERWAREKFIPVGIELTSPLPLFVHAIVYMHVLHTRY